MPNRKQASELVDKVGLTTKHSPSPLTRKGAAALQVLMDAGGGRLAGRSGSSRHCRLLPVAVLAAHAVDGRRGALGHTVAQFVLPQALRNTVLLLLGVGLVCACWAPAAPQLVTAYDFPGRGVLAWALLLPLAVPTYIVAFAYLDLLHPIGPIERPCAPCWATTARASFACRNCA